MLTILQSSTQTGLSQSGIDRFNREASPQIKTQQLESPEPRQNSQALIGAAPSTDISQLLYQARQQKVEAKPRLELSLLQTQSATGLFNTLDAPNKEGRTSESTPSINAAINPSEIASATADQPQVKIQEAAQLDSSKFASPAAADPNAISSQIEINTSYTFEPYKVGEEQLPSYVYDDELNIDGAGRAPTAIFLSDQG